MLSNGMRAKSGKETNSNTQSPPGLSTSPITLLNQASVQQQQHQQQATNQTINSLLNNGQNNANSMAAAAALFASVTAGANTESINCLLLRHLTEILGNQLILTRKIDSVIDGIETLNRRMQGKFIKITVLKVLF